MPDPIKIPIVGKRIDEVDQVSTLVGTEKIPCVQDSAGKFLTPQDLFDFINPAELRLAVVPILTADVQTLFTIPIQVIAAPGANKINLFSESWFAMTFNTTRYDNANPMVLYQNSPNYVASNDGYIHTANVFNKFNPLDSTSTDLFFVVNTATFVAITTANPPNGDSDVTIIIPYYTIDL